MSDHEVHHVACGMLIHSGRVLLGHRSITKAWYPNVWDFPGGHVEHGETNRQALGRELREELGIEIIAVDDPPVLTLKTAGLSLDVWRVDRWSGEIVNAAPDEHDEIRWFDLSEAKLLDLADEEYRTLFGRLQRRPVREK